MLPAGCYFKADGRFQTGRLGVFVFGRPDVECLAFYVVCSYVALVVKGVGHFHFGFGNTVLRFAVAVLVVFVCHSNGGSFVHCEFPVVSIDGGVYVGRYVCPFGRAKGRLVRSSSEGPLVFIVRVVIIGRWSCERALGCGDQWFHAFASPLFLNVSLCRFFVGVLACWCLNLFFRVAELFRPVDLRLYCHFGFLFLCLDRYVDEDDRPPRLVRYVRVREWVVGFPFVVNGEEVDVAVRLCGEVCGVPGSFVQDVRGVYAVAVCVGPLCVFAVCVSSWV